MRCVQGHWLARWAGLASLLVLASFVARTARAGDPAAAASGSPRARVSVLIFADPSTDWGRRVRGQLSDLSASTEIQTAATLASGALPERATPARAAQATPALTAWLTASSDPASNEGGGTFIAIRFAATAKPYTRRLAADWTTLSTSDRSAALELAALSVRSAVRSLLLDRAVESTPATPGSPSDTRAAHTATSQGFETDVDASNTAATGSGASDSSSDTRAMSARAGGPEPAASPALEGPAAAPVRPQREAISEEPEPASAYSAAPLHFGLELGAAWQFYGRTALGAPGMRAGVQLLGGAWGLEVIGQYGWPVSARIAPASFDLQRHALLGELSIVAADFGTWRFCPLLRAGLTWLRRDGSRVDADATPLQASGAQSYRSPFLGAGAVAEQQLSPALSLSLRGVLNVETAIPTFTLVDTSGARVSSGSPWSVQPSLEIGANWRW